MNLKPLVALTASLVGVLLVGCGGRAGGLGSGLRGRHMLGALAALVWLARDAIDSAAR